MKIILYGNEEYTTQFKRQFNKFEYVEAETDIIIVLGGDGTLLQAIHHYGLDYKYLPINYGNLGFLSSFEKDEFSLEKVNFDQFIEFRIKNININDQSFFFVNEAQFLNITQTNKFELNINEQIIDYQATGIEIVTSLGSTGSNRASNGPIIAPDKNLFIVNAILGVNNKVYHTLTNSLIFDKNDQVQINCNGENHLLIDGIEKTIVNNAFVTISDNQKTLKLINSPLNKYYKRLKNKIL